MVRLSCIIILVRERGKQKLESPRRRCGDGSSSWNDVIVGLEGGREPSSKEPPASPQGTHPAKNLILVLLTSRTIRS